MANSAQDFVLSATHHRQGGRRGRVPGDGEGVWSCGRGLRELSVGRIKEGTLELEPRGGEGCRLSGGENLHVGTGTLEAFVPGVGLTRRALGRGEERKRRM